MLNKNCFDLELLQRIYEVSEKGESDIVIIPTNKETTLKCDFRVSDVFKSQKTQAGIYLYVGNLEILKYFKDCEYQCFDLPNNFVLSKLIFFPAVKKHAFYNNNLSVNELCNQLEQLIEDYEHLISFINIGIKKYSDADECFLVDTNEDDYTSDVGTYEDLGVCFQYYKSMQNYNIKLEIVLSYIEAGNRITEEWCETNDIDIDD